MAAKREANKERVEIGAPNFKHGTFNIVGTAPFVQEAFGAKARQKMKEQQEAGSTAKKGKQRTPKDFHDCYMEAQRISTEGWNGINAASFRNAMISACRVVGFAMTRAKLSVFVEADGFDRVDGSPLVKIIGKPRHVEHPVRNDSGVADIRARPMWDQWSAKLNLSWDADQFTVADITNLLVRAGMQVGIGAGRPDSKKSNGLGWGTFTVK